ncbi:MAG: protein kinase [Myxococcota bacterium]
MEVIGPYRVHGVLGQGGVGTVYRAQDAEGRTVAIKVADADRLRAEWFHREASFAARLRHPRIVALLDRGWIDDLPYLVLAYVNGQSLAERGDFLSTDEILRLGDELLDALAYAHDAGVLHLDISPGNVLWTEEGHAMLTDFGLALPRDAPRAHGHHLIAGTPGYLSPEQALGVAVGPRADLYGVGALLYRLIAGFPPHFGDDSTEVLRQTLLGEPLPLRPRAGLSLSAETVALVERLIARDAEARPPSAYEARQQWLQAAKQQAPLKVDPHQPTPAAPLRRPMSFAATAPIPDEDLPTLSATPRRLIPSEVRFDPAVRSPAVCAFTTVLAERLGGSIVRVHGDRGSGRSLALASLEYELHRADARVARVTARSGVPCAPFEVIAALVLELVNTADRGPAWASAERVATAIDRVAPRGELRRGRTAVTRGLLAAAIDADLGGAQMDVFRIVQLLRPPGRPLALLVDDAERVDGPSLAILQALAEAGVGVVFSQEAQTEASLPVPPSTGAPPREEWSADEEAVLRVASAFEGADVPLRCLGPVAGATEEVVQQLIDDEILRPVSRPVARAEPWVRLHPAIHLDASPALRESVSTWLARSCWDGSHGIRSLIGRLALEGGNVPRAAYAFAEAGRQAATIGDAEAVAFLTEAARLGDIAPSAIDLESIRVALAERYVEQGEAEEAARLSSAALETMGDRNVLRARALRVRAKARSDGGNADGSESDLREVLALLGTDGDPVQLSMALASLGWQLGYAQGRNDEGIAFGRRALEVAAGIDAPALRARLCGRLGANQLRAGDWNGQLATNLMDLGLSLQADDLRGVVRAHINLGVCYSNRGLLELSRAHTQEANELAQRYGAWTAAHIAENNLAMIAADQHRFEDALTHAERSLALASQGGLRGGSETWAVIARCRHREGKLDARDEALGNMDADARGAEAPLCARMRALFLPKAAAQDVLRSALSATIGDPYDRATTQLALGTLIEDTALVEEATDALDALGADVELERERWTVRAEDPRP